jgi:amidase
LDDLRAVDLVECSATEIARLVRAGEASPAEVVDAHLRQIDRLNPGLNAIVTLRAEQALEEAGRVARWVQEGAELPLAGVPFTVKDLIAVGGVRTTAGTPFLKDFIPRMDATAVARMRQAGAILLGKTNCPEWGMFGYTSNSLFGGTKNPLGPVTTGGSSGGEAAAIAARCSALGLGTDFGGSAGSGDRPAPCPLVGGAAPAERIDAAGTRPGHRRAGPVRRRPRIGASRDRRAGRP